MKLPNLEKAFVPPEKITGYLLDVTHDEGSGKALFFLQFGFSLAEWEALAHALLDHAHDHEIVKQEVTLFGTRYIIEGVLKAPNGRAPKVRVVWFISQNETDPRLVTAYPLEEDDD